MVQLVDSRTRAGLCHDTAVDATRDTASRVVVCTDAYYHKLYTNNTSVFRKWHLQPSSSELFALYRTPASTPALP